MPGRCRCRQLGHVPALAVRDGDAAALQRHAYLLDGVGAQHVPHGLKLGDGHGLGAQMFPVGLLQNVGHFVLSLAGLLKVAVALGQLGLFLGGQPVAGCSLCDGHGCHGGINLTP